MSGSTLERRRDDLGQYVPHELDEWYEVEASGCWKWLGAIDNKGYGRMKRGQSWGGAHRWMYEGLFIDHLCRNRACVNPEHLEPVTPAENARRGAKAILTHETASEIREAMDFLSSKYGVTPRTLCAVAERRIWGQT